MYLLGTPAGAGGLRGQSGEGGYAGNIKVNVVSTQIQFKIADGLPGAITKDGNNGRLPNPGFDVGAVDGKMFNKEKQKLKLEIVSVNKNDQKEKIRVGKSGKESLSFMV